MKKPNATAATAVIAVATLTLAVLANEAGAQTTERKTLTPDGAKRVAAAAAAEARKGNEGGAIVVVDDGGALVLLERLDGTFAAASNVALKKARTAATFRKATRDLENAVKNGRLSLLAVPEMTPLQGGVPIVVGGWVVGAVGVSGASSAQRDDEVAVAGAKGIDAAAPASEPAPLDASRVTLAGARAAGAAAAAEAKAKQTTGAVAVADEGGALVYVERFDGTFPAAPAVAARKARTAATFRKSTKDFEDAIKAGRFSLAAMEDEMTPLQGGVPIVSGGKIIGAVGVTGAASPQQDEDLAKAGASVYR